MVDKHKKNFNITTTKKKRGKTRTAMISAGYSLGLLSLNVKVHPPSVFLKHFRQIKFNLTMTEALIHYKLASETNPTNVLRFNLTDNKTLQSYKLNYFITQRVIFLIRNDS